jgi:hypothetical protein
MRLIAVSVVCVLASAPLEAQGLVEVHRNAREGFWGGFGVGAGSTGADCTVCSSDRLRGFSGYVRLGGTVSSHVLLGGEANGWVRSRNGTDETMGFAMFIASLYPSAEGPFFLKLGIGGMTFTEDNGLFRITAKAPAGSIGVGYDIRLGRMFSVTPFFDALASSPAAFTVVGTSTPSGEDLKLNLLQLGLGFTWH